MKNFIRKICAAALAGCLMLNVVGCKDDKTSSVTDEADLLGDVAEEDLPYGATVSQLKTETGKVQTSIEYDNRFMTEEEAILISNYVTALNNKDAELMSSTVYDGYLDYFAQQAGATDLTDYLTTVRNNLETNFIGSPFNFNYILVNDCNDPSDEDNADRFASMDATLLSMYGNLNVTDKKLISIEILYTLVEEGGSYSLSNRQASDSMLFIYTIDGKPYIVL